VSDSDKRLGSVNGTLKAIRIAEKRYSRIVTR
jgi:hypothetical protein